jgi:hypothetical protein
MPCIARFAGDSARTFNHVPSKDPYAVGTTFFTYGWNAGGNIANYVSSYNNSAYPGMYSTNPYLAKGSGAPDSDVVFSLNLGFIVSVYTQSSLGTLNYIGQTSGGSYDIALGSTVSGLAGTNIGSNGGTRNGNSSLQMYYQSYN